MRRGSALLALAAVAGPGLLAGLSDDDPAGIATYSILGADYGYELLWVLLLSTVALVIFHEAGARMGVATGQGLMGLIRDRYGVRLAGCALVALLLANLGTTCAEFAGIAASLGLAGVSKYVSVPLAALGVSLLVLRGGFGRVEHVLLALGTVFAAYILAGFLAHPDWGEAAKGLVTPSMPSGSVAILAATATVGTTLAPWGLAFIQSYVVDKRLRPTDIRLERADVITGSIMTGVIGLFVVVACAATLHADGRSIESASDAAAALKPLAGDLAATLFGAGLLGAGLLAASILPLSTAYSVAEAAGTESALDDPPSEAKLFYGTYAAVVVIAVAVVLVPGAPLIRILFLSQALNAILLLPLLAFIIGISRDRELMGDLVSSRGATLLAVGAMVLIAGCVLTMLFSQALGVWP
jgi:NRAMP (natural resistance-associated macrophage protein)-like metal ion transporter